MKRSDWCGSSFCRPAVLLAALAGVTVAAPALARPCTWSIGSVQNGFVPDFDQKRENGPLFWNGSEFVFIPAGLPGEGEAYCSPSSHINWMAYFANHGFPGLMPGGSSPSFQSQSEYETVTAAIAELGADMQTHPTGGTTCCGTSGMIEYLDRRAPGKFIVSAFSAKQLYAPSINDLAFCVLAGGYVCPFIGWYAVDSGGPNQYYKDGGHVITMVGLEGWCGGDRKIKVRDPGNGDSNRQAQATFATNTYEVEQLPGFFADNDGNGGIQVFYQRTHEKFVGYGSPGLLNGYRVIVPKAGVTLSPLSESLSLRRPVQLTSGANPTHAEIGGFVEIAAVEPASEPFFAYVVENVPGQNGPTSVVWRVPLLDDAAAALGPGGRVRVFDGTTVRAVASGRGRELYIIAGSYGGTGAGAGAGAAGPAVVRLLDGTTAAVAIPSLLRNARKFECSDQTDTLILLDATSRKLGVLNTGNFEAGFTLLDLPTAVALDGEEYLSTSPRDGSIWIRSKNSPNAYNIIIDRAAGAVLRATANLPALAGSEGLDVQFVPPLGDQLLVVKDGVVAEFARNTAGGWGPAATSDFAGTPARGGIQLTRSRTNHDASFMEGPSSREVLPTAFAPNEYDCPGDVDLDGMVAFSDITATLSQWGSVEETNADSDASGSVGFGDLTKVLQNWGPCR